MGLAGARLESPPAERGFASGRGLPSLTVRSDQISRRSVVSNHYVLLWFRGRWRFRTRISNVSSPLSFSCKKFQRFVADVVFVQEFPMKSRHYFRHSFSRYLITTTFFEISDQNGSCNNFYDFSLRYLYNLCYMFAICTKRKASNNRTTFVPHSFKIRSKFVGRPPTTVTTPANNDQTDRTTKRIWDA